MNDFKKLLEKKNLSYSAVANLTGISERTIERYANGISMPTWENAKKIFSLFRNEKIDFLTFFGN